jgi:hypothetical protein
MASHPHMSYEQRAKDAREKREYWKQVVETMVVSCAERGLNSCAELQEQLRGLKKDGQHGQKEALMRFLHIARKDGFLTNITYTTSADKSAREWTSFRVHHASSHLFFQRLVELFGLESHQVTEGSTSWRTINNSLERFGLRPQSRGGRSIWAKAYAGTIPFVKS